MRLISSMLIYADVHFTALLFTRGQERVEALGSILFYYFNALPGTYYAMFRFPLLNNTCYEHHTRRVGEHRRRNSGEERGRHIPHNAVSLTCCIS